MATAAFAQWWGPVAMAGAGEADAAVAAAKKAYATWRTSPLTQRIAILFRYRALLDARRDDIAALITAEQGKVHADALAEVGRGRAARPRPRPSSSRSSRPRPACPAVCSTSCTATRSR
jgi:acyl-CoA reductase-like NAD-dependent aldehyde dehydrogenase